MIKSPKILRVPWSTFVKLWDRINPSLEIREDSYVAFVYGSWFSGYGLGIFLDLIEERGTPVSGRNIRTVGIPLEDYVVSALTEVDAQVILMPDTPFASRKDKETTDVFNEVLYL